MSKKRHLRHFVSLKMSKIGFRRFQTIRLDRFPRCLLLPLAVTGVWKSQSLNPKIAKMAKNPDLKVLGAFSPICCLKNLKKNHLHIWSHMTTIGQSLELKIWPPFFGRFFWCENFTSFYLLCLCMSLLLKLERVLLLGWFDFFRSCWTVFFPKVTFTIIEVF